MKKRVLAVILLFLIGTFIVGCSSAVAPSAVAPKEEYPTEADGRTCIENTLSSDNWDCLRTFEIHDQNYHTLEDLLSFDPPRPLSDAIKVVGFEKTNGYTQDLGGIPYYVMEFKLSIQVLKNVFGAKSGDIWQGEGIIPFQKTEKGWRDSCSNIY